MKEIRIGQVWKNNLTKIEYVVYSGDKLCVEIYDSNNPWDCIYLKKNDLHDNYTFVKDLFIRS